ncbi:MAG: hypothetical protein WBD18_04415, partial [Phycisphaerae bacterium]
MMRKWLGSSGLAVLVVLSASGLCAGAALYVPEQPDAGLSVLVTDAAGMQTGSEELLEQFLGSPAASRRSVWT